MTIRFAILAGVSTDKQASDDKRSIPDQIAHCRAKIIQNLGVESAGPFVMDGYSRTNYDSLEVALNEIPPLGDALRSVSNDEYDVLIMDNFDRLGDLGLMVSARFRKLRKQLYSARQSGKLTDPAEYDPYASEANDIDMYVEGIINRYRINKIRRAWNTGVPERARQGLHPLSIPFGYKAAGKNEPAQLVESEAQLVIHMKDLYLAGRNLIDICDYANASAIQPRRAPSWTRTVVKRIILNRFYAGVTTFGKLKTVAGKRIPIPPAQWVSGVGKHQPLWDTDTYFAILAEAERRNGLRARATVHALTGVLSCSVCHHKLHRHGKLNTRYPVDLSCRHSPSHVNIRYTVAHRLVARKIVKELAELKNSPDVLGYPQMTTGRLQSLAEARRDVQRGYEAKIYTEAEAQTRIVAIETELERLTYQAERDAQQTTHRQTLRTLAQKDLTLLETWILHDDPATVNHFLTALCQTIEITPGYELTLTWR